MEDAVVEAYVRYRDRACGGVNESALLKQKER